MSYIGNSPVVQATRTVTEFTATAGQTVFNANGGYTVGFLDIYVNGVQLSSNDFTATNGVSVALTSGCTAGDAVRLEAWGTFMITGNGVFPFYKSDNTKDVINLTGSNKLPFYNASSASKDIALTL